MKIKRNKNNVGKPNGELDDVFDQIAEAITRLEDRMNKAEEDRISKLEDRMDSMEARQKRMDEKLDKLIRLVENGQKN